MIVAHVGCLSFFFGCSTARVITATNIKWQGDLATEGFLADDRVDFVHEIPVLAQVILGILTSLTKAQIAIGKESAALGNDFELGGKIKYIAGFGNAFVEHDIELGGAERRRNFVLDNFDAGAIADDFIANFDGLDAAHIETNGSIEFERLTAGGGFGVAEHDADLLAELVGEDDGGFGFVGGAWEVAGRLGHETGLHAHG